MRKTKKMQKKNNGAKTIFKIHLSTNKNILKKLLNGIVDPMLLYAAPVWIEATNFKWCKTKLRSVQRLILMTTIRSFRTVSTHSALILADALPMEMRAQTLATMSFLKRNSQSSLYHIQNSKLINKLLQQCSILPDS